MFTSKVAPIMGDESGATAIEYGLIAGLVSVAAIGAMSAMGESLTSIFGVVQGELQDAAASVTGGDGADGSDGGDGSSEPAPQ